VAKLERAGFADIETKLAGEPSKKGWASAYISAVKPERQKSCC